MPNKRRSHARSVLRFIPAAAFAVGLLNTCCAAQTTPSAEPTESIAAPSSASYRLTPGDVVSVRLFFNPELNDEVQIRPDGSSSLQLIGEVRFAGRTAGEVTQELERRYQAEVKAPRVTVQVRSYAGQKVFVTGEVLHPGAVSLIGGQDMLSAVAEAGGVSRTGKANSWILVRKGPDGKPVSRTFSVIASNHAIERLQPFDLVIVPARKITHVDRFVDDYIRQVLPGNLVGGFQYLYNRTASAVSVVPF